MAVCADIKQRDNVLCSSARPRQSQNTCIRRTRVTMTPTLQLSAAH